MEAKHRLFNNTFGPAGPICFNACVGDNGFQDIDSYAVGYVEASTLMLDKVLSREEVGKVDILVFPIVFCIRHAVELYVKSAIKKLDKIRENNAAREYKISAHHDIGQLWAFYREQSSITDKRLEELNNRLDPYIRDISEIDPTGQTFRYSHDAREEKHLTKTPVINLLNLKRRTIEIKALLEELYFLCSTLIEEYSLGTHTNNLSREDICEISKRLPNKGLWRTEELRATKDELKREFGISGRELSKAIDIIKDHFQFSKNIDIENKLEFLCEADVSAFFEAWIGYHEQNIGASKPGFVDISAREILRSNKREKEYVEKCISDIDRKSLAEIISLYEFGRDALWNKYSENYKKILELESERIEQEFTQGRGYEHVDHYMAKTNAVDAILRSLITLRQDALLESVYHENGFACKVLRSLTDRATI
ncbi:hypothetical protein F0A17_16165 [Billgrantia pellis]|uniref:Uncharacterized protein n=1 Tax=Billgrantia pellis TaxID=2606936 RepID=A0A7V7G0T7_9GAMM|nr:hypothetical protein [Halomonas pellis]KAA0010751.1 hypothetical protein F0A17_16165 [Halomonas pellis]